MDKIIKEKKEKRRYFRIGDLGIYLLIFIFFGILGVKVYNLEELTASKVEIFVDGKLKYVQKLQEDEKHVFLDTELGGVNLEFKNNMVRAISSNSPKKLIVKQGWIKRPGDMLIGIPDKVVVKIIGESEDDVDYVAK